MKGVTMNKCHLVVKSRIYILNHYSKTDYSFKSKTCTVEKSNWQLVQFVKEHRQVFHDYYLSEDEATETKGSKMARALLAAKTYQFKFNDMYVNDRK